MPFNTIRIDHEEEMRVLAVRIAQILKTGDVITLTGGLGAGKTVFARALVNALAPAPEEVPSPTFTLVQVYENQSPAIWHFDLYRLEGQDEILELGWDEARRQGVAVVEWPERLGSLLPKDRLEINIEFTADSENARQVTFTPHGKWVDRQKDE
ncbi:MAG: tRNA (adenosine(37)-N6)-threonylcarbamoyltransferase complex ATPase subunit type 1 TsaE [bacterium]|nr:tRNA (adenosine(37)-N6)-threonylcarbamoyltransferase complex ATPase subunit type 1 TsaE [bacterium]